MKLIITIEDDGKETVTTEVINLEQNCKRSVNSLSMYAKIFNSNCAPWHKNSEYNRIFLEYQQSYANDLLKERGYLFLNEVYDLVGIARTKAGQVVGWIYKPEDSARDNYVDFGIHDDVNSDFINGYAYDAWLDFNVDGNILDQN